MNRPEQLFRQSFHQYVRQWNQPPASRRPFRSPARHPYVHRDAAYDAAGVTVVFASGEAIDRLQGSIPTPRNRKPEKVLDSMRSLV